MGAAPQILGEADDGDAPRYATGARNPLPLASASGLWDHQCGGEGCKVATQPESSREPRPLRTGPRGTSRPTAQRECPPGQAGPFSVVRGATQVSSFEGNSQHCPPPPPPPPPPLCSSTTSKTPSWATPFCLGLSKSVAFQSPWRRPTIRDR